MKAPNKPNSSDKKSSPEPVALQLCDFFVARTQNWIYDHLKSLDGYRPVVWCEKVQHRHEFSGIEAYPLTARSVSRRVWNRFSKGKAFPADVRRLKYLSPSVVHSHFGRVALRNIKVSLACNVPWLVSFYGADAYQGRTEVLADRYSKLFASATYVLALGPKMQARLVELGCAKEKTAVHALGVDVNALPKKDRILRKGQPLRILFAGTFREKKGVEYLLLAAAELKKKKVPFQLRIVGEALTKPGDRDTQDRILRLLRNEALDSCVTIKSLVTFAELVELALASHVFVAPSVTAANGDSEGTPFVIQQMMATRMPVVTTDHSDIPFIFGEQRDLLVPERDSGAIADRLQRYADAPELLIAHGRVLEAQIRHFDVHACAMKLGVIYDRVRRRTDVNS